MTPTRETFGNIPPSSQFLFYVLAVLSTFIFGYGVWRRFRLWRRGQPSALAALVAGNLRAVVARLRPGLRRVLVEGLGQQRVKGRGMAGRAHVALFAGFMVLLLGTTLLEIDHLAGAISRDFSFHRGLYYRVYEFSLDVFGLLFLLGCGYFLWRRLRRPASVGHHTLDWWVLALLIAIGVTGYLVEGLRMVWQQPTGAAAACSPVGGWVAAGFSGLDEPRARLAHFAAWWLHAVLVFGFFAAIPFTRLFHFVAGPLNLFLAPATLGTVEPISLEDVERDGRVGVSELSHFTQQQLLSLDACVECGRCEEACPAFATGKPLSPKAVVLDLRRAMEATLGAPADAPVARALHGETISAETLWSCTSCSACVQVCPLRVDPLTMIVDLRRHLVAEGALGGTAATALRRLQSAGNPWGLPTADREAWRAALNS